MLAKFLVSGNDEGDTQSLASHFVADNRDKKGIHGDATCKTSVCQLLSKETRTAQSQHQAFLVITV